MPSSTQIDSDRLLDLTKKLIERPSISPADEGCQTLLAEQLTALGFEITSMPFEDVTNLWAVLDSHRPGPTFLFAGHTDVVPPGPLDSWTYPPFEPTCQDGWLYGRGSADMKSALAAMVFACEQFIGQGQPFNGKIAFLITSDEEAEARHGTRAVMEALSQTAINIDYCLVGEPSSANALGDMIRVGRRGSLNARLTIQGKSGHVAYPHTVINPIHLAMPALSRLADTEWDQGNAFFPATSFQISNLNAGVGVQNVVPQEIVAAFNFRYSTASTEVSLKTRTEAILADFGLPFDIEWSLSGEPFLSQEGALIDAAILGIQRETGLTPELSTGGGTSDGRFIAPFVPEIIELGLLNTHIHKIDERVPIDDIAALGRIYTTILDRLLRDHV
jgi:succinyl-diaminopimelate desuccinylase